VDVEVTPLFADRSDHQQWLGAAITFQNVTHYHLLKEDLERTNQELETAYEEVQSSNEELETTNEELQSTVEELQTTNEELQSSNEEMETMNEELQSTNEELQTMNSELRQATADLHRSNAFLESILGGLRMGVVVVDQDLQVLLWNERAEDQWGLRAEEVTGRSLLSLDIGLPVAELGQSLREFLVGEPEVGEVMLQAVNRRGRPVKVRIALNPLRLRMNGERGGVVLLMEEQGRA
jgi:two-component system CheB/CheR fusion protein